MANVGNLGTGEGAQGVENEHPKFEINREKIAHRLEEPPAEPRDIGLMGRRFSPEQMREAVTDDERSTPLCGDLIHSDEWVMISGQSGTGKTAFAVELAGHLARPGSLFMGHPRLKNHSTRRMRGAFMDLELRAVMQRQRSSSYWGDVEYIDLGQKITREKLEEIRKGKLTRWQCAQQLLWDTIESLEFDYIVIDSLQRLLESTADRRHVGPFVNLLSTFMDFYRNETGRHILIVIISHPRKGGAGEASNMEQNSGDGMLTNQCDNVLMVRHGRDLRQAYVTQAKEGRGHAGIFTGMRTGGDGECLVYHRHAIEDPVHKDNFGIKISHERHLERDVMPQVGKGSSEEGRAAEIEEVARFMNLYAQRTKAEQITPAAVSKAIERASASKEIDLQSKKTIAPATLERMGPELRKALNQGVAKRLSANWD